jgi:hypothetical protein
MQLFSIMQLPITFGPNDLVLQSGTWLGVDLFGTCKIDLQLLGSSLFAC